MILINGEDWNPTDTERERLQLKFPDLDVVSELERMNTWCLGNVEKRPLVAEKREFVTSWLVNASKFKSEPKAVLPRYWTVIDELTHDFLDSESFRETCIDKYGQYMSAEGNRVIKHYYPVTVDIN